jgi:hypothetical protein
MKKNGGDREREREGKAKSGAALCAAALPADAQNKRYEAKTSTTEKSE